MSSTPKQNTVASCHQRIAELEAKVRKMETVPAESVELTATAQTRQYTGRVFRPNFGQALPANVGYHNYVSVRVEDDVIDEKVVPPTEEDVLVLLRAEAAEQYPDHIDVELADISVLPAGW